MAAPLQVIIADQEGVDVRQLIAAIEKSYRTPEGRHVTVKVGQGQHIDGIPNGMLRLVDRTS